jgi:hypothetical protein
MRMHGWPVCVALAWLSCTLASAQTLRDPTQPPPIVAANGLNESGQPAAVQSGSVAVVVRQGVPHLVVGSRLYAKGQKVGLARIERITETEVWLREDGVLRKIQVFGGIERRASVPKNTVHHPVKAARELALPKP